MTYFLSEPAEARERNRIRREDGSIYEAWGKDQSVVDGDDVVDCCVGGGGECGGCDHGESSRTAISNSRRKKKKGKPLIL